MDFVEPGMKPECRKQKKWRLVRRHWRRGRRHQIEV
jgi:hypothetical protein